jgi:hypothetical protein
MHACMHGAVVITGDICSPDGKSFGVVTCEINSVPLSYVPTNCKASQVIVECAQGIRGRN